MQKRYMNEQCVKKYLQAILNRKKAYQRFYENFIKNYDENSDKGYIFEVDVKYPQQLHDTQNDLPFLSERMKIKIFQKPICNLYDKDKIFCTRKNFERNTES